MVLLSGGWSGYIKTLSEYAEVWGPPLDAGAVSFLVRVGGNVAELTGYAARSVGPVWGALLVLAPGRVLWPRVLASEPRLQLLVVLGAPAILFYVIVHIGNLGYLLSVLPVLAMVESLTAVELADELALALRPLRNLRIDLAGPSSATLIGLSCLAESAMFVFSRGPVSWAEIRDVDTRLSVTRPYLAKHDPSTTLVLAYDHFAQLQYYLTDYKQRQHIRSLNDFLGPDTQPTNRRELVVPPNIKRVVLADLNLDMADRPTGLQRLDLGRGTWLYEGSVAAGDAVRVGYGFTRIAKAGVQAQQNLPAGP
jgi:hypothetical protein